VVASANYGKVLIWAENGLALSYHSVSITIKRAVMLSRRPRLDVSSCVVQSVKYWSRWVWNRRERTVEGSLKGQLSNQLLRRIN